MSAKKSATKLPSSKELEKKIQQLQDALTQAEEKERRAQADYQNLVRRSQHERSQVVQLANRTLIEDLIEPLENLKRAAEQIKDPGLDMVIKQLWQALESNGVEELSVEGKRYDVETMEVVDRDGEVDMDKARVVKVVQSGYRLGDYVIKHAKVVVGAQ